MSETWCVTKKTKKVETRCTDIRYLLRLVSETWCVTKKTKKLETHCTDIRFLQAKRGAKRGERSAYPLILALSNQIIPNKCAGT